VIAMAICVLIACSIYHLGPNAPGKRPTAGFTALSRVCAGEPVQFVSKSTAIFPATISAYSWDFNGDGEEDSTDQDDSYCFPSAGSYRARLAVTDSKQRSHEWTQQITVSCPPTTSFATSGSCLGAPLQFRDTSVATTPAEIEAWSWDFGDGGGIQSDEQDPRHQYDAVATYRVTLTVTDSLGCSASTHNEIAVCARPTARFTATRVCLGSTTGFTDESEAMPPATIVQWSWDLDGDGEEDRTESDPTHPFSTDGQHSVKLIVTDSHGCSNSCEMDVVVYPLPSAQFVAKESCFGADTHFVNESTANAPASIQLCRWDFDGDGHEDSQEWSPTHQFSPPGSYTARLTVTDSLGCSCYTEQLVRTHTLPAACFTATSACLQTGTHFTDTSQATPPATITRWSWDFDGDGTEDDTERNPAHEYPTAGVHRARLTVTDTLGCCSETERDILVHVPPTAAFSHPYEVFVHTPPPFTDESVTQGGASIEAWSWDFEGDACEDSTEQNPSYRYESAGTYAVTLTVTDSYGCANTVRQRLTVGKLYPAPTLVAPQNDYSATSMTLLWKWDRRLEDDERFKVLYCKGDELVPSDRLGSATEKHLDVGCDTVGHGSYTWAVVVVRGPDDNCEHLSEISDMRVFRRALCCPREDVAGQNGVVTSADVNKVRNALGTEPGDEGYCSECDFNGNKKIDEDDVNQVLNALADECY